MPIKTIVNQSLILLLTTATIVLLGCAKPEQPMVEAPPKAEEPAPPAPPAQVTAQAAKLPPPQPGDIEDAVKRVFQDAAQPDKSASPYFLVGDFNGDASEDLGVVLKPDPGKLDELNAEYPRWLTRDPLSDVLPKPAIAVSETTPSADKSGGRGIPVLPGDNLFAVIHGYGPKGWHDPEATQTFLLKNIIGSGMRTLSKTEVAKPAPKSRFPQLEGDVINQTLLGQPGFLYYSYSGLTYKWYDPKHNRPENDVKPFHGMKPAKTAMK